MLQAQTMLQFSYQQGTRTKEQDMANSVKTRATSKTVHISSPQGTLCGQSASDLSLDFQDVDLDPTCKRCIKSHNAESTKW